MKKDRVLSIVTCTFALLLVLYVVAFIFLGPASNTTTKETYAAWVQGMCTLFAIATALLTTQYQVAAAEARERRSSRAARDSMFSTVITLGERMLSALDGIERFHNGGAGAPSVIMVGSGPVTEHHPLLAALANMLDRLPLDKLGNGSAIDHAILLGQQAREIASTEISGPGPQNPAPQIRTTVFNHLQALRAIASETAEV